MALHRLRIVFLGTAQFAVSTLRALAGGDHHLVAVITRPDRPAGRGRAPRASPVKRAAEDLGLPVFQPERVSQRPGLDLLQQLAPEVVFVAAFGELLSEEVLSLPRLGAVNLHASLLPKHRGAAPIQRAILAGEQETGVTVQWMARELDAGDILLQRPLAIGPAEDFGSLHDRLARLGAEASVEALALIRDGAAPRLPQPREGVSYARPIGRQELVIDWGQEAEQIVRVVRAFSPDPGARTSRKGRLLKVLSVRAEAWPAAPRGCQVAAHGRGGEAGRYGRIVELTKEGFWVSARKGRVLVTRVQPEARRGMSAPEYVNGYRLSVGEQLGL